MIIKLSPQRRDDELVISKVGDILTVNGIEYDFTPLLDGATLPWGAIDSEWFAGDVNRIEGELVLTILLPHGVDASEARRFPSPLNITADGIIELPE